MRTVVRQLSLEQLIHQEQRPLADSPEIEPGNAERARLYSRYASKLTINPSLTRALVSFQANKNVPFYRWFNYREAFSSELVRYCLKLFQPRPGRPPRVLDPFAGAGTTLTTAAGMGWQAVGIELLPVGIAAIQARLLADTVNARSFERYLNKLEQLPSLPAGPDKFRFPHLRITEKAFPAETEAAIAAYRAFLDGIDDSQVRYLFWFACLAILEDVSYTRKDGQYLRWDARSGRVLKSHFHKGLVCDFQSAIIRKLRMMLEDIRHRNGSTISANVEIIEGSCLSELPLLPGASFDLAITSPPYCNRYDYTRTYALELAFLGYDEKAVKELRQTLLSATVENKTKRNQLAKEYRARNLEERYQTAVEAFTGQRALHEILHRLHEARRCGQLNNDNIPNLVANYFFEMNLVIHELARIIAPGGHVIMVNDNVRYAGEEVPVDLLLSDLAASAGLSVDAVWVLPRGKGNSSQQMGTYGRKEMRKCVYVWSKPGTEIAREAIKGRQGVCLHPAGTLRNYVSSGRS